MYLYQRVARFFKKETQLNYVPNYKLIKHLKTIFLQNSTDRSFQNLSLNY
jgi:hypothetical protein